MAHLASCWRWSMQSDHCIPFALDEKIVQADQPLLYRPWGTRTIKLKLTTHIDMPKLWVRPLRVLPEETALGIYKAYADDSHALHVTWGGGHENGPCVKTKDMLSAFETCAPLQAGDSSYLFFNLTHAGAAPSHLSSRDAAGIRMPRQRLVRPSNRTKPGSVCRSRRRPICPRLKRSFGWCPENRTAHGSPRPAVICRPTIRAGGHAPGSDL